MKPEPRNLILTKRDEAFIAGQFKAGRNSHEIAVAYGYPEQQVLDVIRREREARLGIAA